MTEHAKEFIVNGTDFMTAVLENGWARVGLKGVRWFDFPPTHATYKRVMAITTEDEAESLFDECMSRY